MKVNQLESFSWQESTLKPCRILSGAFHATPVDNDGLRSYAQLPTLGLCHTWAKKSITLIRRKRASQNQKCTPKSTCFSTFVVVCVQIDAKTGVLPQSLTSLCHFSSTDGRKYSPLRFVPLMRFHLLTLKLVWRIEREALPLCVFFLSFLLCIRVARATKKKRSTTPILGH